MMTVADLAVVAAVSSLMLAGAALVLLVYRARKAGLRARGCSPTLQVVVFAGATILLFAGLGLVLRATAVGGLRWVLGGAGLCLVVAAVGALWAVFGTALAWDSQGVVVFGLLRRTRIAWSSVGGVTWRPSKGFALEGGGRAHLLPWNRKMLEDLTDEISRRRGTPNA